ncbi:MAG TPA: DEAD/DEAH box helicase family protein [bacterium]|nr:DEAD/DEAH box helicase family protein [bacterium]
MQASEIKYQITAIQNLSTEILSFLAKNTNERMFAVLKAPTGSGKTYMASQIIDKVVSGVKNTAFIWLSIGTGNIHIQSKESLERYYGESPKVRTIEYVCSGSQTSLREGEILVINWEKIRTKDKKGEWKNIAMKDGDNINFREILDNTTNNGIKIILIVDESHLSLDSDRGKEIVELIRPSITLEISATPKIKSSDEYRIVYHEEVKAQEVIGSGMIKNQIIVNENIISEKDFELSSSEVLRQAFLKRKELKKIYEKEETNINPLVLIQVANAEEGDAKIEEIEEFLEREGVNKDNGKLAIWLSEDKDKINLVGIRENYAKQEFLIFKEAVATGWDCPRAQILVKYRETKSEIFKIQVIGRILRMPEQKHYKNSPALNKCYIYTNQSEADIDIENYNPNILGDLCTTRNAIYKSLKLLSYYRSRADYQDIRADFHPIFASKLKEAFELKDGDKKQNIINLKVKKFIFSDIVKLSIFNETEINTESIDILDRISGSSQDVIATEGEIYLLFRKKMKNNIYPFTNIVRSTDMLCSSWYIFCSLYLFENMKDNILVAQKMFLNNKDIIVPILKESVKEYDDKKIKKSDKERDIYNNDFEIKEVDYLSSKEYKKIKYEKCLMSPCYLKTNRSDPEKEFEKYIDQQKNIAWWYKNGALSAEYLGIRYEYDNKDGKDKIHTAYPDYVVKYTDERIGIFETKHKDDAEHQTWTKTKAEAMAKYIEDENKKGKNLFGGIVVNKDNNYSDKEWRLNDKQMFDLYDEKDWIKI